MQRSDLLLAATLDEVKAGFVLSGEHYRCLCCGETFESGLVYPADGVFYDAQKFARRHVAEAHGGMFTYLLRLEKTESGLSDLQRRLLGLFYAGRSDEEVRRVLGIGSRSTVRNHRFLLHQRERQAKIFLALMGLLREREGSESGGTAQEAEETATASPDDEEAVLHRYFPNGTDGPLRTTHIRQGHLDVVLRAIAARFVPGRDYTEPDIEEILAVVHEDHALLRRRLVDRGLLERLPDGSRYWRPPVERRERILPVERRELKRLAKEANVEAGVYQIRNKVNGKMFVDSTRNLKTIGSQQFQLQFGMHTNRELQRDYEELGKDAFAFEVLEVLDSEKMLPLDEHDALKRLYEKWLAELQPFGERGYNRMPTSRHQDNAKGKRAPGKA